MIPVDHPERVRAVLVAHAGWMPVADGTFADVERPTEMGGERFIHWQHAQSMAPVRVDPSAVLGIAYGDVGQ